MIEKVYRAGMICYYVEGDRVKMLFMRPSDTTYSGDEFQMAKGRVDPGEEMMDAAVREAKEEVGLFVGNMADDPTLVGRFLGRTDVFVVKIHDPQMFGEPSDETDTTAWMTIEEFDYTGRPLHRPVVRAAYEKICELEGL